MTMTPLQRKAAFQSAVILNETTIGKTCDALDVSEHHLRLVLLGERVASEDLEERIAAFAGVPRDEFFGPRRVTTTAA